MNNVNIQREAVMKPNIAVKRLVTVFTKILTMR